MKNEACLNPGVCVWLLQKKSRDREAQKRHEGKLQSSRVEKGNISMPPGIKCEQNKPAAGRGLRPLGAC